MAREYWWGEFDRRRGKAMASERLLVEAEQLQQLSPGTTQEVTPEVDWDYPFWLRSERLDTADLEKETEFYFILTVRFGEQAESGSHIEWEQKPYSLKVVYPYDFPSSAPKAYIVSPADFSAPHMWPDTSLCLYKPADGRRAGWDPTRGTGLTIALWSIQWLRAYRVYYQTGVWPGEDGHYS